MSASWWDGGGWGGPGVGGSGDGGGNICPPHKENKPQLELS